VTGAGDPQAPSPERDRFLRQHKHAVASLVLGLAAFGFAYYFLPEIVDLGGTLKRLRSGNPRWLVLGMPLEALSLAAYVMLFHAVLSRKERRIGWKASYQIAMAGGGATKLFAAAGSGGVAVTVWALRGAGLSGDAVARGLLSLEILNYCVYMSALVIFGAGLWLGVFAGPAPVALTLLPALFGLGVIVMVLSMRWLAGPAERFMLRRAGRPHARAAGRWLAAAHVPRALQNSLIDALAIVRGPDRSWLAAIPAWGFDIAVLWASFRAFGHSPPAAPLIMGYYVGTLGNVLPLPGGIGGVEGGMIGSFIGFGVSGSLAVVAVLAYRTISYWLPLLPESVGYLQLRGTVSAWRRRAAGTGCERSTQSGRPDAE
jgi:uncharacterized membrane protein YbhN (UPF0104 family)